MNSEKISNSYSATLRTLKEKIKQARLRSSISVNKELLSVFWEIGNVVLQQQKTEGWGTKVIDRLANDLKSEFPDMQGFSSRNIKYMRAFAEAYPHFSIVQEPLAQINKSFQKSKIAKTTLITQWPLEQLTWYHHITLLDKIKDLKTRYFYMQKTIENGWSRNVMVAQIESTLHKRQGNAINNFETTLTPPQSDLAKEALKSPYVFDFLNMSETIQEKDLEKGLIQHFEKFMLELGRGFALMGRQYKLVVKGDEFFLDLIFYNHQLRCFIVFELKVGDFKSDYAGQLNFYINAVDEQLKGADDAPTIGVLLCKTPNETVVKYSLHGIKSPMGVAEYQLAEALPKHLKSEIPSIAELEAEIDKEYKILQKPVDEKLNKLKELIKGLKEGEVNESWTPENMLIVLNKVVFPLKKSILNELEKKEIISYFKDLEIIIWTDSNGHKTDKEAKDYFKKYKGANEYRIEICLNGFKQAGTKAFNAKKEVHIKLSQYKYTIGLERNESNHFITKLYDQLLNKKEVELIVDKFSESLLDYINGQIERITK